MRIEGKNYLRDVKIAEVKNDLDHFKISNIMIVYVTRYM